MTAQDKASGRRIFFRAAVLVFLLIFLSACATVPLTGRQQLQLVSEPQILKLSLQNYREILKKSKLSQDREKVEMLNRAGRRIASATEDFLRESGLEHELQNYSWEFKLIDDDETANAFCMPGGKIAVYSGLWKYSRDEAGLAVVIGHEVAHAVAKHGSERMSQALLVQLGGIALAVAVAEKPSETKQLYLAAFGAGATIGIMLPYSRQHEYEADRIGLTLMARAGYDPREAVGLWQRMNEESKGKRPPEWLSTHPAPEARIEAIRSFLPEARQYYRPAGGGRRP